MVNISFIRKIETLFMIGIIIGLVVQAVWSVIMGPDIPIVVTWIETIMFLAFTFLLLGSALYYLHMQKGILKVLLISAISVGLLHYWRFQLFDNTLPYDRPVTLVINIVAGFGSIVLINFYSLIRISKNAVSRFKNLKK